ncbi:nitrite transporter [Salmonella enterica subsp. enterica serovar Saintpaul]|uniref:Nitrite transporter n=2 Tax=Salmonella enterica TaxID=28901 RepID=A0A5V3ALF7_SALER|nr:nitrite transporter [Salmonella enterica]EBX0087321.1 nitrite transporter [Salmonella enterica subsp. enterica serovar Miami]ECH9932364.1 nitrite transporter [Salmonella enterica subsp. houtenae]EDQ5104982.1 nitrite transporter [Salmonella enterica subsp. enterica serovar Saintpaul]EEI9370405.1 nitrite transporter [Salmonella enterica subsp. enterica serovar Chester]EKR1447106.1 nitrite transporter [Salmonella enterica subsp. houtenae serovar 48:z4,z32:-]
MFNQEKYLSVRWLKGGRTYPELDCFGVVNEVRRDLGLYEWPDFAGVTKDDNGLDRKARELMLTLQHCEPCEGAGVACYSGSTVTHVGVVVNLNGRLYVAECNPESNVSFTLVAQFIRRFVKVEFWQ